MTEKKDLEDIGKQVKEYAGAAARNPYLLVLLAVIGFSAFIRFKYAFFQGMWVDESVHGRLAKELPKHLLEYSLPEKGGALTKRPPVYSYLLAFSKMILGGILGTDTAIRLVSPLMGVLGVISTYFLGREIKNREVGLAAAALVSVNGIFWFLSERILMGATLTTLFTATLLVFYYGLEDRKYSKYAVWAWGPMIVLTFLTKQPGYVLGPVILIYFLYRKREALSDYFMTDKDLKDSELYTELMDRNYWIALGLFFLLLLPWMIRNMGVCEFPLCSFKRALAIAITGGGRTLDVQGPLYFLKALPGLLTLPVFAVLSGKVLRDGFRSLQADEDLTIKKVALMVLMVGGAYFFRLELVPLFLLSSIAMFARSDGEKLLWLAAGLGIGVMSINATKVARYIVFVMPALIAIAAAGLWNLSSWISNHLPKNGILEKVEPWTVIILLTLPLFLTSYSQNMAMVTGHGYTALEPAGEWLDRNTPEDSRIASTSPQIRYYAYPRMPVESANRLPDNETAFKKFLRQRNVEYVVVDVYERTQPDWMNLGIPPYRLSPGLIRDLRSGRISGREVVNRFQPVPEYLKPLKSFGQNSMPLTGRKQPKVIVYGVNNTAL
ncbi:MAG: ArnT family glycosyltransferase [Candidatus Nanosalina sp.]